MSSLDLPSSGAASLPWNGQHLQEIPSQYYPHALRPLLDELRRAGSGQGSWSGQ